MVKRVRDLMELAVLVAAVAASLATSELGPPSCPGSVVEVSVPRTGSVVLRAELAWDDDLRFCLLAQGVVVYEGPELPTASGLFSLDDLAGEAEVAGVGRRLDGRAQDYTDAALEEPLQYYVDVARRRDRLVDDDPLRPPRWESYVTLYNPGDEPIVAEVYGPFEVLEPR